MRNRPLPIFLFVCFQICSPLLFSTFSLHSQDLELNLQNQDIQGTEQVSPKLQNRQIRIPKSQDFFSGGKKAFPKNFQLPPKDPKAVEIDSRTQVDADYPVGPGDQFLINFWGKIDDNLIVAVDSERKLYIPRIGVIDTAGTNYKELQDLIAQKIKRNLRDVQFTVALYRPRSFQIYVLGAVGTPGPQNVSAKARASDVVALAGGVQSTGSKQFIEVRRSGSVLYLDLLKFASSGDFSENPFVTDNDVIFVPPLEEFITVSGAIVSPGAYEIKKNRNLSEIIKQLGGLSTHADRTGPIKLSRLESTGSRKLLYVYQGNERKLGKNERFLEDTLVQHGDEIFIPSSELLIPSQSNSVFVTGEVKIPGAKSYRPALPIEEYIGMAGGLTARANFADAVLYKADGSTVRVSPRTAVEPGDTIFIPEKTFKFWQDHLTIVTTFISLATSIIVLSGR